jgi:hypothetical protein
MAIAVHPFVTGQPHRIGALDAALEYICSHACVLARHRLGDRAALPGAAIEVSPGYHLYACHPEPANGGKPDEEESTKL